MTLWCVLPFFSRQLLEMTCQVANVLKDKGVMKGDRVIIYMPAMPLAVASMLACARIGAVHWYTLTQNHSYILILCTYVAGHLVIIVALSSVVFSEFSAEELRERIVGSKFKQQNTHFSMCTWMYIYY